MASKRLTTDDMDARAEALEEAADHLDMSWTTDTCERRAGNWASKCFRAEAGRWRKRSQELKGGGNG